MAVAQNYYHRKAYSVESQIRALVEKNQRLYSKFYKMGGNAEESGVWWGRLEQMEGRRGHWLDTKDLPICIAFPGKYGVHQAP